VDQLADASVIRQLRQIDLPLEAIAGCSTPETRT
jgi:hypothetical protein